MRNAIVKGLCAGVLWLLLDAPALWAQSSTIAPLVSTGVSAAMSLGSMANSLAAQQRCSSSNSRRNNSSASSNRTRPRRNAIIANRDTRVP